MRASWRAVMAVAMFAYAPLELMVLRPKTRPERAAWLSRFCKRVLKALDVTYTTEGPVPTEGAVLANHLTFFDILLHSAMRPCVFVSKIELRKTPLLGWMSFMAGTVYVTRGGGGSAAAAGEGMAKGFRDGLPVVFFPEGTTGVDNGVVLPFRTGLLAQAIAAEVPVHSSFTTYSLVKEDREAGRRLEDDVFWGEQSLMDMAWRFMKLHGLHAKVRFADGPIAWTPEALANRKVAGVESRAAMSALMGAPGAWDVSGANSTQ